jgi:hypothetical protein
MLKSAPTDTDKAFHELATTLWQGYWALIL